MQQNEARLRAWVPWLKHTTTVDSTRHFIRQRLQRLADGNGWTSGIWCRGSLAGEIGFDFIDRDNRFTEIGYRGWRRLRGQGAGLPGLPRPG